VFRNDPLAFRLQASVVSPSEAAQQSQRILSGLSQKAAD
jgi:hypothetical protein